VPPGQRRAYWALFRGYRFPGSDVPRRIVVTLPGADGRRLTLPLGDPARGLLRWNVPPLTSGFMFGVQNTSLYGAHLEATGIATQVARFVRVGRVLLDAGISSRVLVETRGALASSTSSFVGLGLGTHAALPFLTWGPWQEPRSFALYGGGEAQLLVAIEKARMPGDMTPPSTYGAIAAEAGLELEVGARRPAASPFPLSTVERALPRWLVRVGYTHWWVGRGGSDGYTTSFRIAW
jgi:hypothetical protein